MKVFLKYTQFKQNNYTSLKYKNKLKEKEKQKFSRMMFITSDKHQM